MGENRIAAGVWRPVAALAIVAACIAGWAGAWDAVAASAESGGLEALGRASAEAAASAALAVAAALAARGVAEGSYVARVGRDAREVARGVVGAVASAVGLAVASRLLAGAAAAWLPATVAGCVMAIAALAVACGRADLAGVDVDGIASGALPASARDAATGRPRPLGLLPCFRRLHRDARAFQSVGSDRGLVVSVRTGAEAEALAAALPDGSPMARLLAGGVGTPAVIGVLYDPEGGRFAVGRPPAAPGVRVMRAPELARLARGLSGIARGGEALTASAEPDGTPHNSLAEVVVGGETVPAVIPADGDVMVPVTADAVIPIVSAEEDEALEDSGIMDVMCEGDDGVAEGDGVVTEGGGEGK